ncbi:preprotein translocase subunit SecA [Acidiferrobacter sp. SPIII_3]|uniref:preprotein translocase subunit SecA n=1 Tax=Acidiferrobacter sp. SPIII_3 TaxID=1281578 RepID=UPI000D739083|nr:preprotein translocase subunit SecA [Acidiferrobacter sp. SPIII_3]
MAANVLSRFFGSRNDRVVRRMRQKVAAINGLESRYAALSDDELRGQTATFRQRLENGEPLEALLPEAFAVVREGSRRVLGMRHFDVQLIGGMVLHEGKIAEMRTGEGKTLVATLAAYLNALPGSGVHVVTVNDYLASRDAEWMGRLYRFLGLSVGTIVSTLDGPARREAYNADITYGTNNEFGFDYLRDNMAFSADERVQRRLHYAVVDEVDSILIDEARTPLIISGPTEENTDLYVKIDAIVPRLKRQEAEDAPGDYTVDEKAKQVYMTEEGHETAERLLAAAGLLAEGEGLYDLGNMGLLHHLNAALRAHAIYHREVDYIVTDGQIVIVDEFTGRMMPGRRWSDGLHQAVEAKERVEIQNENQTLASITFQNYFRLYDKLAGMTGTADTEAFEFQEIYNLEVTVIPTHRPAIRKDHGDQVYRTTAEKHVAIVADVGEAHKKGQPVLVGTASIESSESLSALLKKANIPHEVLNAKHHEREAHIIAQAGREGAVTIATNMAGRGTDIVLGGNPDTAPGADPDETAREGVRAEWQARHDRVIAAGGLKVIGTERHESRRIDNQLRGRSGRQGDPGETRFYLSLEDNLMRIFGSDRVAGLMEKLGMEAGDAIEHPWVTKAIENAQRKVEAHNFDIRKQLLEYDDVANDQRKVIYEQRNKLLVAEDVSASVSAIHRDVVDAFISEHVPPGSFEEQWDIDGLKATLDRELRLDLPVDQWLKEDASLDEDGLRARIQKEAEERYREKTGQIGEETMRHLEKAIMLQVLDLQWKDHLAAMDHLRQGIQLRGYAQKSPQQEYKREAFELFSHMLDRIKREVITTIVQVEIQDDSDIDLIDEQRRQQGVTFYDHPSLDAAQADMDTMVQTVVRAGPKVGRNDPCPCGSGKKYKQCHGRLV